MLALEIIRSVNCSGKTEAEIRYFLSSCLDEPDVLIQAIRRHWTIESLHWVLDATFRNDECRIRDRIAVQNMALRRKIALNVVRSDKSSHASLKSRRKMAGWDDEYLLQIIT